MVNIFHRKRYVTTGLSTELLLLGCPLFLHRIVEFNNLLVDLCQIFLDKEIQIWVFVL